MNKDERVTTGIVIVGVVVLAIGIVTLMLQGQGACERDGGRYVRGVLWFECVAAARP